MVSVETEEELDELVKAEFGVDRYDQLTDLQKKYKDKIAAKLAEVGAARYNAIAITTNAL